MHFPFELIYFNSSTAKVLMGLFEILDEAVGNGNVALITWSHEEEDDNMEEKWVRNLVKALRTPRLNLTRILSDLFPCKST